MVRPRAGPAQAGEESRQMSKCDQDRRGAKRVESKVWFEAAIGKRGGGERPSSFETVNLSTSGLHFKSDQPLEPMTRFELEIMFSGDNGIPGDGNGPISVKGEGTVVWVAPDVDVSGGDRYEVGVFFSRLDPAGKKRLAAHVDRVGRSA